MEEEKETIKYDRIMGEDYITIRGETDDSHRNYQTRMIAENRIAQFLECSIKRINTCVEYRYRISSMCSLKQLMEKRKFTEQDIRQLILSLSHAIISLEEYLLSEEKILLDPQFIFVDSKETSFGSDKGEEETKRTGERIKFCYYPEKKESFSQSVKDILPYILKRTDHEDGKAIILSYSLYQISLEDRITMGDLTNVLNSPLLGQITGKSQRRERKGKEEKENRENIEEKKEKKKEEIVKDPFVITESEEAVKEQEKKPPSLAGEECRKEKEKDEELEKREKKETFHDRKQKGKEKKKNIREFLVPFFSALLVFIWFGYHYMKGEFLWMENPELYTGIILLIIASNMVYVFGNTFRTVENEREKRKREGKRGGTGEKRKEKEKKNEEISTEKNRALDKARGVKTKAVIKEEVSREANEHKYALLSCQPDKIPNIPVRHFPFVVGRKAGECDFQIMDASIRKKHAGFHRDREEVYLTDYSSGFTSINGHILEERECLQVVPGQEIRFSDFSFIWADQKTL